MHEYGVEKATDIAIFDEVSSVTVGEERKDYSRFTLREEDVDPDPIRQFRAGLTKLFVKESRNRTR